MKKAIIFDASSLISFSMNGLYKELEGLKKIFGGSFLIPEEVKVEVIDKPLKIKRFELEGLRLKKLLDEGVLELPKIDVSKSANELMNVANSTFSARGKDIKLLDLGEVACLALSKVLNEKQIENILAVDERTLRSLCETPESLRKHLSRKLHTSVKAKKENYDLFKDFKIIRSAELIYVAHKKGLVELKDGKQVLDALLYALKFKGCSISDEEIREMKRI
ncbi:hypothetical protein ACFL0X_00325 [Nanoarchaeota archaeon]